MRRCVYYNRRNRDTFKTMRLNKGEYNMNYNVICSVMFAIAICGCRSKSETPPSNTEKQAGTDPARPLKNGRRVRN